MSSWARVSQPTRRDPKTTARPTLENNSNVIVIFPAFYSEIYIMIIYNRSKTTTPYKELKFNIFSLIFKGGCIYLVYSSRNIGSVYRHG